MGNALDGFKKSYPCLFLNQIEKVCAKDLKKNDYLIIPKFKTKNRKITINSKDIMRDDVSRVKKKRKLDKKGLRNLLKLGKTKKTSKEIGKLLGMHPVYLRKLLNELKKDDLI